MECKNCNTALSKLINYCPICGAKIVKRRLTLKHISEDINEQFFNIDNKLLRTFKHLFTKPEIVINGFIEGTRKKYVNVIQYFAISLTLVGLQVFIMNTFFKEAMEIDPNLFMDVENLEGQEYNPLKNVKYEDYNNYQSVIYVLTIPFSAITTWLAYWILGIRHFNFTEHVVINLYYSAQIIIVNAFIMIILLCFGVDFLLISYITSFLILIYFLYVLKRVFQASFLESLAHFLMVMLTYLVIFVLLTILAIIVAVIAVMLLKK